MTDASERPLREIFQKHGALDARFDGFKPRLAQEQLAVDIQHAIENKTLLVAEAGTGTGKTLAYLIPALLSGKKILVSTGTKTLQDQLISRDVPTLRTCLSLPAKIALLKGRSNYLCLHALENAPYDADFFNDRLSAQFTEIRTWAKRTKRGDIAELEDIPEDSPVWPTVTSTVESCLGIECAHYEDCFLVKARKTALQADMVIINHHLFFADLQLKQQGFSELLPNFDAVIFDEAHQLPDIASQWFGERISSRQIIQLVTDTEECLTQYAPECVADFDLAGKMRDALKQCRLCLPEDAVKEGWSFIADNKSFLAHCSSVHFLLGALAEFIEPLIARDAALEKILERIQNAKMTFTILTGKINPKVIPWFETTRSGFTLHQTPMSVASHFNAYISKYSASWIFCSATLAVERDFSHFCQQLGLVNPKTAHYDSPFDYSKQALVYLPRHIPDTKSRQFNAAILEAVIPVIKACKGRTLFLFTSYRSMTEIAERLQNQVDFPILIQGSKPKPQLLTEFIAAGNAILLATASFWEGVDIRGDDLVCVIIDKLPFAAPNDPVLQERMKNFKAQGKDPFYEHQLPEAVISLRQGVGRLIRSVDDKGIIVLTDPRLCAREYAHYFWNSLPPIPITRDLAKVEAFLS